MLRERTIGWLLGLLAITSCGPTGAVGDDPSDEFEDGRTLVQNFEPIRRAPRVDMILVVDDSPSMRAFQFNWALNLPAFADVIEAPDVEADIRIAITTTSVPGPACPGSAAKGGEPILSSCRAHLDDFVGPAEHGEDGGGVVDHSAICEDACSFDEIPRVPSLGHDDHDWSSRAIRPWIEPAQNPFGGNLYGISLEQALTCAGLQGFAGCSFESPIEAAARMVDRMSDAADPMFEFRRPDAILLIVMIGDEDDCSHSDAAATIFDPAGARTFWPDPDADQPSSAICTRAGLECDDEGCELTDHALDGSVTTDPADAVLTPPDRLTTALEAAGEYDNGDFVPVIGSIGGFRHDGSVHYTPVMDGLSAPNQTFLDGFGVLPGCAGQSYEPEVLLAAPAGRIASIATEDELYSICEADYSSALAPIAEKIYGAAYGNCIEFECVANLDPTSPVLVPDCVIEEVDYAGDRVEMPLCLRDDDGWVIDPVTMDYTPPAGESRCWTPLTDPGGLTSEPYDDSGIECVVKELIGDIRFTARAGTPLIPYDSHWELRCRPCDDE